MFFYYKKLWLYLILLSLFTSIVEAEREKSLDDYYLEVEKTAQEVSYGLEGIKNFMNEIYKPDKFMNKDFRGLEPKWYVAQGILSRLSFTTRNQKLKDTYTKKIRNVIMTKEYSHYNSYCGSINFGNIHNILNLKSDRELLKKNINNNNIKLALEDFKKYENRLILLIEKYIFLKLKTFHDIATVHYSSHRFPYSNEEYLSKIIYKNNQNIRLSVCVEEERFHIKSYSKSQTYSMSNDLLSIFDEYVDAGLCKKTIERDSIKYESLKNTGEYKNSMTYSKRYSRGLWSLNISSEDAEKDFLKMMEQTKKSFKKLKKLKEEYSKKILEKIIQKYTKKLKYNDNSRFGNEF